MILIDDARLFGTDADYPTISYLTEFLLARRPQFDVLVQDDIIRVTPKTLC